MNKQTAAQIRLDLQRTQREFERADSAAHQARLILEAAQKKHYTGDDGDASILIDAAKVILDRYAEDAG